MSLADIKKQMLNNKNILFLFIALLGLGFSSCEKEPKNPIDELSPSAGRYLLVGNEGAYGTNTASISLINLTANTVENNVYKNKNAQAMGDILQSMERVGNRYYFMIDNSDKILVTDTHFNKVSEITGVQGPRYLKAISATQAYVTSLFNNKIYIIDLVTNTKVSEISMTANWTEQMVLLGDATGKYIYVCENDTAINYITKIDVATSQVVDKIMIGGYAPSQIGVTSDNHLWVLAGNNVYGKVSTLTELEPTSGNIVNAFTFNAKYTNGQMAIGPKNEKYITVVDYTTNKYGVYKFINGASAIPNSFFVSTPATANFYGISVDPSNGDVYISDTKGFTQSGDVNRYSSAGELLNSWTTGLGPSSFYFVQ